MRPVKRHIAMHTDAKTPPLSASLDQAKQSTPMSARMNPTTESHMQTEWRWSSRWVGGCPRRNGPTCSRWGFDDQIRHLLFQLALLSVVLFWIFMLLMYAAARILLLLLTVYSFYSLPDDVYETPRAGWLSFIPFFH